MNTALVHSSMLEFLLLAAIVAVIAFGWLHFSNDPDRMAIKVRKDGKREYERISSDPDLAFPLWIKILIFILIASVLFMPLDFMLNRS